MKRRAAAHWMIAVLLTLTDSPVVKAEEHASSTPPPWRMSGNVAVGFLPQRPFLGVFPALLGNLAAEPPSFASLDNDGDERLSYEEAIGETRDEERSVRHWRFFESDADDDGKLTPDEYSNGPTKARTSTQDFHRRDEDRDQALSSQEFLKNHGQEFHKQLARDFQVADLDGNRGLNLDEFRILPGRPLNERGPVPDPISEEASRRIADWRRLFPMLDRNADDRIGPGEFAADSLKELETVGGLPFEQWDRNSDGAIDAAEGDRLVQIAYGITRPDGEPLRHRAGRVINWVSVRRYDKDGDGKIARDEFLAGYWEKEKSADIFASLDRNSDGAAQIAELFDGPLQLDTVERFLWLDTSLDGLLDQAELDARSAEWEKAVAKRVIPCYDENGDGRLTLAEYRRMPLANPSSDWFVRPADKNHDGTLSFEEFSLETSPILIAQSKDVFRRFDRDQNGTLSLIESDFAIDPTRVPPEIVFESRDLDRNGRLTGNEFAGEAKFSSGDGKGEARAEAYLRFSAEKLAALDSDKSGDLSLKEFREVRSEPLLALRREFLRRDLDLDGQLSREEYVKPHSGTKIEPAAAEESVRYDRDDDGFLTWEEFEISPPGNPAPQQRFAAWDRNQDGALDESEFLRSIPEAERLRHRWPFLHRDLNADSRLNFEEWQAKTLWDRVPLEKAFSIHDPDGDGRIRREDYLLLYPDGSREAARTFLVLDFDADGSLTPQEFAHRSGLEVPAGARGPVPDPIAGLCDAAFSHWKTALAKADTDKDGRLSATEWSGVEQGPLESSLGAVPFEQWDQNGDNAVDEAEGESVFRQAFGVLTARGVSCRSTDGGMVNINHVERLDKNKDGNLTPEEFAGGFARTAEENRKRFDAADGNRDGVLTHDEYSAAPDFLHNRVRSFFWWDANTSGRIEQDDLLTRAAPWQRGMAGTLIAAFDTDGDKSLSFREFDVAPFGNLSGDWYAPRDKDGDGRLAWDEFRPGPGIALAGIARHYFDRFDSDRDGFLSLTELEFPFDPARIPPKTLLALRDRNGDGLIDLSEMLANDTRVKSANEDGRSRRMRAYYETWLTAADANSDRALSAAEFQESVLLLQPDAYEVFQSRDTDQDQRLSREEYVRPNLGNQWEVTARAESERFDVDKNGFLEWHEFRMTPPARPTRHHMFAGLDIDQDGKLTLAESLGTHPPESQAGQRLAFRRLDRDGDGVLTRPEWIEEITGKRPADWEFRVRDDDENGELAYEEFVSVIEEKWRKNEARNFRLVDWNHDGRLSLDEFRCLPGRVPPTERGPVPDPVRDEMEQVLESALVLFGNQEASTGAPSKDLPKEIASIPRSQWDRDRDGRVSAEECRKFLELAYGVRDEEGRLIRQHNGRVVNHNSIRNWDKDKSGTLSRSEFVSNHWNKKDCDSIFVKGDLNGDGEWDWSEIVQSPDRTQDVLEQFLGFDTNLDATIDQEELDKRTQVWEKSIGTRLISAFDGDGDRHLSFAEFRWTPLANPLADWYVKKRDADNSAQLSWNEFFDTPPPLLIGLSSRFFHAFDRNQDSQLDIDELEFQVDPAKVPVEIEFRMADRNRDQRVDFSEVFRDRKPDSANSPEYRGYQIRLARAEDKFQFDDKDRDNSLSLAEFTEARNAAVAVAERHRKATGRLSKNKAGDWFLPVFLTMDVIVLAGVSWFVLRRRASRTHVCG